MSLRAFFLIVAASVALNLSILLTALIVAGYVICAYIDSRLARQTMNKLIETETEGWEVDSEDPRYEDKGGLSRLRLADKDQIIVTRIAELLRKVKSRPFGI